MRIDALTPADLDAALGLSRQAGWNQVRADWRRLLDLPTARCFAGRVDGAVVATSTVITYEGRVSWIGMVLVDRDHRRQGYGTAITEHALDYATTASEAVGLDATDAGRSVYRDLGFVDVAPVERWCGTPEARPDAASVDRVCAADFESVAAFDAARCGVDRDALLGALLDEPRVRGFVTPGRRGYAILRPGRERWQLGPVVADGWEPLEALLAAAAAHVDADSLLVDVVGDPPEDALSGFGLSVDRTLTRMSHGRRESLLCGDAVYGAAGLELG